MSSICLIIVIVMVAINADTKQCTIESICECTQNEACILKCIGNQACIGSGTQLICKSGYPCTIICNSDGNKEACSDTVINTNGATDIKLTCTGDLACLQTALYCDTSQCSIDCRAGSPDTCKDMSINTNNAVSFNCYNDCSDPSIPNDFSNITPNPTKSPTGNPSITPTKSPATAYPTISLSANPTINPSMSPTNESHTINPSTLPSNSLSVVVNIDFLVDDTVSDAITSTEKSVQESDEEDISDLGLGIPLWMIAVIAFGIACCLLNIVLVLYIRKRKKKSYVGFESPDVNKNDKQIAVRTDRLGEFKKDKFAKVFNDSDIDNISNIICEQIASKQRVTMHDNMTIKLVTIPENNQVEIQVEGPPKILRHIDEDVVKDINQDINQTAGMEIDDMDVVETLNVTPMLMEYMDEGDTIKNGTQLNIVNV